VLEPEPEELESSSESSELELELALRREDFVSMPIGNIPPLPPATPDPKEKELLIMHT